MSMSPHRTIYGGSGSVTYDNVQSAQNAVDSMNLNYLGSRTIRVNITAVRGRGRGGGGSGPSKSLFSLYKAMTRPSRHL